MKKIFGSLVMVVVAAVMTSCINPNVIEKVVVVDPWVEVGEIYLAENTDVTTCRFYNIPAGTFRFEQSEVKTFNARSGYRFEDVNGNRLNSIAVYKVYIKSSEYDNENLVMFTFESPLCVCGYSLSCRITRNRTTLEWYTTVTSQYPDVYTQTLANYN